MLASLCIHNFTTVEQIDLDFKPGLTSITGETGAGKSVLLDTIALALGGRSNKNSLRDETKTAEASALFVLNEASMPDELKTWLLERELVDEHATEQELILRRVLRPDGRSKAFINGAPATLADIKWLGERLVDLHSQHEYQSLLKRSTHQLLLDDYAQHHSLVNDVANTARQWRAVTQSIEALSKNNADAEARKALLRYQVEELDTLQPEAGEVQALEKEQKILDDGEQLQNDLHHALQLLQAPDTHNAIDAVTQARQLLQQANKTLDSMGNCIELLESASIQLQEATTEIEQASSTVVIDPQRLTDITQRLDALYDVARKHNINPELIVELHEQLRQQLASLDNSDEHLLALQQQCEELTQQYRASANKLSKSREKAAKKLAKEIQGKLAALNMEQCRFEVSLTDNETTISALGNETVEFLITTIPGKPPAPLARIASGGELSRISLAIQVVTAQTSNTPTLVFDEVDVGIGGGTAEVVGNLLRELGNHCQVLCVTHQAQVAAKGHQHLLVSKETSRSSATTRFASLDKSARTQELARMIGGIELTDSTLAHAREMIESA